MISTRKSGGRVILAVKDSGTGIPPAMMMKLGKPFVTTKEQGTGLGLTICYRIAQRHGATIVVDTQCGQGTEFQVHFPLAGEGAHKPVSPA